MAVPARKTSKTKKRMRRGHIKLNVPGLTPCPNCGYYDGKQVVNTNN